MQKVQILRFLPVDTMQQRSEKYLEETAAKQFLNKRNFKGTAHVWFTGLKEKAQKRHKDENLAMEKAEL